MNMNWQLAWSESQGNASPSQRYLSYSNKGFSAMYKMAQLDWVSMLFTFMRLGVLPINKIIQKNIKIQDYAHKKP